MLRDLARGAARALTVDESRRRDEGEYRQGSCAEWFHRGSRDPGDSTISFTAATTSSGSSNWTQWVLRAATTCRALADRVGQLAMFRDLFGRLIPTRDHHHRDSRRWIQGGQGFALALQHAQMFGHGVEALRLTPHFLNDRMNIRR